MITTSIVKPVTIGHALWVRVLHWIVTGSFLALAFSGIVILMCHPRLYWGEVGNDLTPALFELPISRNYQHGGWNPGVPFFSQAGSPVSAGRTYEIFNQNGWGRSLHFLAAWFLVAAGVVYLLLGILTGHFRKHIWPQAGEFTRQSFRQDIARHLQKSFSTTAYGPRYGLLQKCTYALVIFFLLPLIVLTGLTMSPAITATYPFLLKLFLGAQSARTIHFFAFVALILFLIIHIVMVIRSGFKQQIHSMTIQK